MSIMEILADDTMQCYELDSGRVLISGEEIEQCHSVQGLSNDHAVDRVKKHVEMQRTSVDEEGRI